MAGTVSIARLQGYRICLCDIRLKGEMNYKSDNFVSSVSPQQKSPKIRLDITVGRTAWQNYDVVLH